MNIFKALSVPPLLWRLRTTPDRPSDLVDLVFRSNIIRPLQVREEFLEFARVVDELKPSVVLEIGTAHGGTLCVLTRLAAPGATILSVDLPGGAFGGGYKWFRVPIFRCFPRDGRKLHLIRDDSHRPETLAAVRDILGSRKLDLLFIDGDHSYQGVRDDFTIYLPLVRPGGMVGFHDIAPHTDATCEVPRFWNEIKGRYRHREIIRDPGQGWAGIGVLHV